MKKESKTCSWCGRKVYFGLRLCTLHGDYELSKHFIREESLPTYFAIQSLSTKEEEDEKEKKFRESNA